MKTIAIIFFIILIITSSADLLCMFLKKNDYTDEMNTVTFKSIYDRENLAEIKGDSQSAGKNNSPFIKNISFFEKLKKGSKSLSKRNILKKGINYDTKPRW